jgi:hypothetical protein
MPGSSSKRRVRWGWLAIAAATALVIVFFVFGIQTGSCVDYVSNAAVDGCSSGPAVGWPGAVLFAVIGALAIGYFVYRALRRL